MISNNRLAGSSSIIWQRMANRSSGRVLLGIVCLPCFLYPRHLLTNCAVGVLSESMDSVFNVRINPHSACVTQDKFLRREFFCGFVACHCHGPRPSQSAEQKVAIIMPTTPKVPNSSNPNHRHLASFLRNRTIWGAVRQSGVSLCHYTPGSRRLFTAFPSSIVIPPTKVSRVTVGCSGCGGMAPRSQGPSAGDRGHASHAVPNEVWVSGNGQSWATASKTSQFVGVPPAGRNAQGKGHIDPCLLTGQSQTYADSMRQ